MIIIGLDGADYHIAKNILEVNHLQIDMEPTHTATMWSSYLSGVMPEIHGIKSWEQVIGKPADLDYIWYHGDWTVFAAPVCMPPISINCSTSDYHLKAEDEAWNIEIEEFKKSYQECSTDHYLGVIRCLDVASHTREKEIVLQWYEKVFGSIEKLNFDILLSDHGFSLFNKRGGEKDHSKNGLIKGLEVKRASQVVDYIKQLKESTEPSKPVL
jgi:hypothetical protein